MVMSKTPGSAHLNLSLGALCILGGAMGYVRKGSSASLIGGLAFGSLLVGSGMMIAGESQYQGHMLATGTSGIMAAGMGYRFFQTGKFMPSGLLAALGAVCCAYNMNKGLEWAPSKGD
jgi:uncharacterized membrane protein (UPF0136 family)